MSAAPAEVAAKPRRTFTPRSFATKLSPGQARRQGHVAREAWQVLGDREAVMAFLNGHHDALGGRPLDLAVDSDLGLERVLAVLAEPAAGSPPVAEKP